MAELHWFIVTYSQIAIRIEVFDLYISNARAHAIRHFVLYLSSTYSRSFLSV